MEVPLDALNSPVGVGAGDQSQFIPCFDEPGSENAEVVPRPGEAVGVGCEVGEVEAVVEFEALYI